MYDLSSNTITDIRVRLERQWRNRPYYYIVGAIYRDGRKIRDVEQSTGAATHGDAAAYLARWIKDQERDHQAAKESAQKVALGAHNAQATVTVRDAVALYRARREQERPMRDKFERMNLSRFEDEYGDLLIYEITPARALTLAREFLPHAGAAGHRRYGTALISALYNAAAEQYTSFEARVYKHDRGPVRRRPAANAEWVADFLALTNNWQPMLHRFQVGRVVYDLDANTWRVMLKASVLFLFTTASRIGETSKLKWGDVDFASRRATMLAENRKYAQTVHKMLSGDMLAALQNLKALIPSLDDLPVFPFLANTGPAKSFNKRVKQVCGDELEVLTSHEIGSHGCITMLIEAGLSNREIAEIVGKDEKTISLYGATTDKVKLNTIDRVFRENCGRSADETRRQEMRDRRAWATNGRA